MTVKAWLEGHQFDLQDLAELLNDGDVRVVHDTEESAYYLTAPEIDNPSEPNRFDIPAQQLIVIVNGLGRVRSTDFIPVKLAGGYTDLNGTHIHVGVAGAEFRFRGRASGVVSGPDGEIIPGPPSPWPGRLALAQTNQHVARVLQILGRSEKPDWYDLYKVHELICRDVGGQHKLYKRGWTTDSKDGSFTASANRYDVSGDSARHAVDKRAELAKKIMTIDEGRAYISDLVTRWLDSLSNP